MTGVGLNGRPELTPRLVAVAESWGCPVTVTPQSKSAFPEDHPLFAGAYGMYRDEPLRALNVARQLGDRAVLLTYEGWGHGTYNSTPCAQAAIDRYLITLARPAPDTRCPAIEPAPATSPGTQGYAG